jgi:hypothetical protein
VAPAVPLAAPPSRFVPEAVRLDAAPDSPMRRRVRAANGSLFGFAGGPGASPVPLKPDTTGATDLGSLRDTSEATPVRLKPDTTGTTDLGWPRDTSESTPVALKPDTTGGETGRGARPAQSAQPGDPLWNGMAIGAAIGAAIGMGVVPASECKPSNPECPALLRIGVGIPAVAGGAALGALVDKLWK